MKRDHSIEPTETLRDAIRYAENIKIAYDLIKEKSPREDRMLAYLLRNLHLDIDALLQLLYDAMKQATGDIEFVRADRDVAVDDKAIFESDKIS